MRIQTPQPEDKPARKSFLSTDDRTAFLKRIPVGIHPHTLLQLGVFENAVEFQFTDEFKKEIEKESLGCSGFIRFSTPEEKQEALIKCNAHINMMVGPPTIKGLRMQLLEHDPRSTLRIHEIPKSYCESVESLASLNSCFSNVVEMRVHNEENDLMDLALRFDNYNSRHQAKMLLINHALELTEPDGSISRRKINIGYKMQASDMAARKYRKAQAATAYKLSIVRKFLVALKHKVLLKQALTDKDLKVLAYASNWSHFYDQVEEIKNLREMNESNEVSMPEDIKIDLNPGRLRKIMRHNELV